MTDLDQRLAEAGRTRRAHRALDIPALIIEARDNGYTARQLVDLLDVTESYVHRVLREHRAQTTGDYIDDLAETRRQQALDEQ